MKRAAIYVRVSTRDRQNPEMQVRELREYCARREWDVAHQFEDHVSGAQEDRAGLDQLLAVCRRRLVDVVVVYRYDRFARSVLHLVRTLEEFRSLGVDFVSIHEAVDTSRPDGRLVFTIIAGVAEFERELIRQRVRSGIAFARARGKRIGRPRVAVDAARVALLRAQGRSWSEICQATGLSKGTAQRSLPKSPGAGMAVTA